MGPFSTAGAFACAVAWDTAEIATSIAAVPATISLLRLCIAVAAPELPHDERGPFTPDRSRRDLGAIEGQSLRGEGSKWPTVCRPESRRKRLPGMAPLRRRNGKDLRNLGRGSAALGIGIVIVVDMLDTSRPMALKLGMIDGRAYVVVYTMRGSAIRIVSARKANGKEVANYEYNARQD